MLYINERRSFIGLNIQKVEEALYQKCLGYTVPVKKLVKCKRTEYDERGHKTSEQEQLVEGEEETFVAPSVSAQMFFLKNRDPEHWGAGGAVLPGDDLELEPMEEEPNADCERENEV